MSSSTLISRKPLLQSQFDHNYEASELHGILNIQQESHTKHTHDVELSSDHTGSCCSDQVAEGALFWHSDSAAWDSACNRVHSSHRPHNSIPPQSRADLSPFRCY